jgi:hypothetical protein
MAWLWIVLLLIVAGAAVWYFLFKNKGSATSRVGIDHDRVAGSAQQAKGSLKDTVGSVLGDTKLRRKASSTRSRVGLRTRQAASRTP